MLHVGVRAPAFLHTSAQMSGADGKLRKDYQLAAQSVSAMRGRRQRGAWNAPPTQ